MCKWEKFSKEQLQSIVRDSYSIAEIARKLGYREKGGSSYKSIYNMINYYNFDISHLLGQSWNKNSYDYSRLQNGTAVKSSVLKRILVKDRGYKCECCGLTEWNGYPIALEIHHKDGNSLNNELNNLCLLCPNCHSITFNWKKPNTQYISDNEFINALNNNKNIRQALISLGLTPKGANYKRAKKLLSER